MATPRKVPNLGHVVVIGGCGFLGHHIVNLLFKESPQTQVSVIDLRTTKNRHDKANYYDCNITDAPAVEELFAKLRPDAVIHTASPVFIDNDDHELFRRVNVEGTKVLVKAAQDNGVKAFVYTSSGSVILGHHPELHNGNETYPTRKGAEQPEYYTTTKVEAEEVVLAANRVPNTFLTCSIRPCGLFGEGDIQMIPKMILASKKGQTRFQVGYNNNLFDFTYIGNAAHAHILAATALLQTHSMKTMPLDHEKVDGEAFFITNDSPLYFWDFARRVWFEAGDTVGMDISKVWVLPVDFALGLSSVLEFIMGIFGKTPNLTRGSVKQATLTRYFDITKAKQRLGYVPLVPLEDGIQRAVKSVLPIVEAQIAAGKSQ